MKSKEVFVYFLLALSIVSAFGGFAMISRGESYGWLGVTFAVPLAFFVYRNMHVSAET